MAGRAGRRRRQGGGGIGPRRPDGEGLIRWQGESRRKASGPAPWLVVAMAAGVAVLATIAAQTAGWRAWTSLLMVASVAALLTTVAVWVIAAVRRGLAWLAG